MSRGFFIDTVTVFLYTWDNRKEDMLKEEKEFYQTIVNTCQNLANAINNLQLQVDSLKEEIKKLKEVK